MPSQKKIGACDFGFAAIFNAMSFALPSLPSPDFATTLAGKFGFAAAGTVITAAGVAAGRFVGGKIGTAFDVARHHEADGRYRKIGAVAGGAVGGGVVFMAYQTGVCVAALLSIKC